MAKTVCIIIHKAKMAIVRTVAHDFGNKFHMKHKKVVARALYNC